MKKLTPLLLALLVAALLASPASAATITVTSTVDGGPGCNLRDAIAAANKNETVGACNGDSAGSDTILLEGGKTYKIEQHGIDDSNDKGDFDIAGPVTIRATGSGLATIDGNNVIGAGGADDADRVFHILFESGTTTLERLRITGGFVPVPAVGIFVGGAGIYNKSDLILRESEVVGNKAAGTPFPAGGGIFSEGPLGSTTIEASTIADNSLESITGGVSQEAVGGGIAAINGAKSLVIVSSTIADNRIDRAGGVATLTGGGIYAAAKRNGAPTTLQSVTIVRNSADNVGGAEFSKLTIAGTIIAGNNTLAAGGVSECRTGKEPSSLGGNLIGLADAEGGCNFGSSADLYGSAKAPVTPNVGLLANNGGLTRTALPNGGSPAIDRGGSCPPTDQRGFLRIPGAPCDAGAVEVGAALTRPTPAPVPGATTTAARLQIQGKAKLTGGKRAAKLTLQTGIFAVCPAGGGACNGRIKVTPPKPPPKGSGLPRFYGAKPISLAAGKQRILKLKLTPRATALARKEGDLRIKIVVQLGVAGAVPTEITRTATAQAPAGKPGR
jgi:hypothetical protein